MYKYIVDALNEILEDLERMNENVENITAETIGDVVEAGSRIEEKLEALVDEIEYEDNMLETEYKEYEKLCKERSRELRPCPFCGGTPTIQCRIANLGGEHIQTWVRCRECGCETGIGFSIDETANHWNGEV